MIDLIIEAQKALDKDDMTEYERLQKVIKEKYESEGL